jgi:hypothetical protein
MEVNPLSRGNSINPQRAFYSIEVSRSAAAFIIDNMPTGQGPESIVF